MCVCNVNMGGVNASCWRVVIPRLELEQGLREDAEEHFSRERALFEKRISTLEQDLERALLSERSLRDKSASETPVWDCCACFPTAGVSLPSLQCPDLAFVCFRWTGHLQARSRTSWPRSAAVDPEAPGDQCAADARRIGVGEGHKDAFPTGHLHLVFPS